MKNRKAAPVISIPRITFASEDLVAAYRYNGLNFRIGWHSDVTANGGGDPDGVVDSHDPWFWFCYDDRWRVVAVFRAGDELPKEVFVHHNAGLAGYGGSSYIDSVILRDRDTSSAWHEEIDEESVRDERVYYAQNWRGDVSALLTDTGSMIEWVKYSAYGVPYSLPAGDTDSNGTWDEQDNENLLIAIVEEDPYDVRFDTNLDGTVDYSDIAHANSIAGGYQTLGRGVQSSPAVANRVGYTGYQYDPTFKGASRTIYHVRHRVYDVEVGRWTRRDPLGYVDGMSMYEYVRSRPVWMVDPRGTDAAVGGGVWQPLPGADVLECFDNCRIQHPDRGGRAFQRCVARCAGELHPPRLIPPQWPAPGWLPPLTRPMIPADCLSSINYDCGGQADCEACCDKEFHDRVNCIRDVDAAWTHWCNGLSGASRRDCYRMKNDATDSSIRRSQEDARSCRAECPIEPFVLPDDFIDRLLDPATGGRMVGFE